MEHSAVEAITTALTSILPGEVIVTIISMLPILELRGGLVAASLLHIPWHIAFPLCVLGCALPLPFIVLFLDKIFLWLKKTPLHKMVDFFEKKAATKSDFIAKHQSLALFFFVAMPIPMMGGWSGALIASVMRMRLRDCFMPLMLGTVASGLIVSFLSYTLPAMLR